MHAARATAAETRRAYRNHPAFVRFDRLVHDWITNPGRCVELKHKAFNLLASGEESEDARLLLQVLARADLDAPELYRGFSEEAEPWSILEKFAPGRQFDLALASFSSDRLEAENFAWIHAEGDATEVVFVLRAGSQAVRIDVFAPDQIHWREREWYTGGRFRVVAARRSPTGVEITLEQIATYDV